VIIKFSSVQQDRFINFAAVNHRLHPYTIHQIVVIITVDDDTIHHLAYTSCHTLCC